MNYKWESVIFVPFDVAYDASNQKEFVLILGFILTILYWICLNLKCIPECIPKKQIIRSLLLPYHDCLYCISITAPYRVYITAY